MRAGNAAALLRKYRSAPYGPRCLSVRQPWAGLIAAGIKTIELRSWKTNYRGPLVICSARGADPRLTGEHGDGPRGAALCLVDLVDCRPAVPGDTRRSIHPAYGYAWVLENVRPIDPTPILGRLNFFPPTPAVLRSINHVA